jgi:hypothetical protein
MGCPLVGQGSNSDEGKKFFSTAQHPDWLWSPPSPYIMGARVHSPGIKWLGCEADHTPSSSAEVKNSGAVKMEFHTLIFQISKFLLFVNPTFDPSLCK